MLVTLTNLPAMSAGPASANIPLDSPLYEYFSILGGFGLIQGDVAGLKPYSKSEGARLLAEASQNMEKLESEEMSFAREVLERSRELLPREVSLYHESTAPLVDFHPFAHFSARYALMDGVPRNFDRLVYDPGNQSAFGFIGGNLRPINGTNAHLSGTEGTPLFENNEGAIYRRGSSGDVMVASEAYMSRYAAALVEPRFLLRKEDSTLYLNKGYLTIGTGGAALEIGRDSNWFGPGYRGATTLTNNAHNFDQIKLWSPEPIDVGWLKRYVGNVKYALIASRFDETGTGEDRRKPYFIGAKLAVKPTNNFEVGINFVRQAGGPGFSGDSSLQDMIFGGGTNDRTNSISGIDLRYRIPALRNSEIYVEYSGEDSASFWPFVESVVAGIYVPRLSSDGRTNLRLEYFWGSRILYTDWQFPKGYVYRGMTPGHSQGGASQDIFLRLGHYLSVRNHVAVEFFHTERGNEGRQTGQTVETKNAGRIQWSLPLIGDAGIKLRYGIEKIHAMNLERGNDRVNQLLVMEVSYPQ